MDRFQTLCSAFAQCRKCRDTIPAIRDLPHDAFRFHWKPYWRGVPPLEFVFLAWEPSFPRWSGQIGDMEEGSFSEPLLFAINHFLLSDKPVAGFLITNMAQCSMDANETADSTRKDRYLLCSGFLTELVAMARGSRAQIPIVSIGQHPKYFLDAHPDLRKDLAGDQPIQVIYHYSRRNTHFRRFARENTSEFEAFAEHTRRDYEEFIHQEHRQYGQWYEEHPANSRSDLERIFKWKHEIATLIPPTTGIPVVPLS